MDGQKLKGEFNQYTLQNLFFKLIINANQVEYKFGNQNLQNQKQGLEIQVTSFYRFKRSFYQHGKLKDERQFNFLQGYTIYNYYRSQYDHSQEVELRGIVFKLQKEDIKKICIKYFDEFKII